jgi:site-specific DNA-cytosine methylase
MFDEQDRQYFYNEFKNNGYEVGSYDDFKKDLNNKEDRDWYYNEAKNMGYDVGTLEDFDKMVLEPAPSTSGGAQQVAASAQSNEKSVSTETKPQVAQPVAKPAAEKPKEDNRSWFTKWMTGSLPEEEKPETADKEPGLIAKALGMIPTGVQTSNGTYQPSPAISQPVVKGEEKPVKEEASPSSSSANAASPESKEAAPVTTPTSVVNNEGLMDAKLANYLENWKQRPDKQGTYFENMVADLLADGTANSNEEAVSMVQSALGRYANRSAMDVTNQVVSALPDDTVQDAEKSIEAQWYSHGVQDKLKQEADSMGISYDDYVAQFLKPAMVQSLVNKYGPNYRDIAEGIATRLYAHDEHVQDRLMNQDINEAFSSVINKYVNPSVVDEYNKAQEAGSKAFTEGMEGSQFIPANLRLGTALGAQYEANEAKDPAKVLSGLKKKFGKLYRNPEFQNDMSNAAFKVMQRYGLNGTLSGDPKQFKPMITSVLKNELDQLEIKGMMPKGSAEYIMKTGLGNTIVGKITRKAIQTDYQNWLEDIANQQYQPGFWENVASGALTFAGDAWSYWLPGAAGGKLTKSMIAKAEGKLAGDLMAKGMERRVAARAAKLLIGKSKIEALKSGAVHGAVTFGGQSAISKPIDEVYRTGQFDENGKIYNPSVGKVIANTLGEVAKQSAVGAIMQGGTIANMVGKGRGLATNILADIGGKVADSGIMTGQQLLERMAHDPNFKPTGKDAAETFLESGANLLSIGFPGFVGKYARFKDAREFNKKFDFTDQDIAELKRFGYEDLRDAFEKVGIGEYAVEGENAQRLDGQLTQKYMNLMNDKSVPEVLKAKMMAVVEGKRPSSFSPVVDSVIVQPMDNGGKAYLETLNKDGGIIERKEYSSLDEAQKADKKLEYEKTLGLASVLEGEFHNEFTQEHLDGLYNQAAQKYNMGEKLTDEDKAAVYLHQNAGAIKDIMDKQQKGIILTEEEQKQVDTYRHFYNSALENSSVMREFVNTFEDSHGVARGTLRKALESKDKKYAPLVESYLKELYNSIELKREMKQIEDDKKRIEQDDVDGAKPATPVEGPASVEGSAGGQEPPVSEGSSPYQGNTDASSSQGEGSSTVNVDNSSADVITSDAFVMGQNAYKNGDSEALQAIDYNSDLATGRLKRAFADNEKMPDIVANAYNEGRDMEQFVAQRASSLTPAQKEAISKYVEAMDAKKGAIDALQHADDGYGESLKEQLWPYQTEDGNIVPATLTSGKQVFLKKANEYGGGFVVVPDEQGQPTIKQVSNAEIKEVGTPVSLDEYIQSSLTQQKEARNKQFISQFDGSGLKPNDRVAVAMEEGDANIDMTFAGYSEDGKIVLSDGKDYLPLSKEEFAAWRTNALNNTINERLDREDDEREQKAVSQAEADKKLRFANGIVGLSEGQPDYSSKDTDTKVAADYLQEQYGEDHGKLLNLVNGSRDDIKTQLDNKKKAAAEYQNWLDTNADLDPEKAKKVEDELSLVNEQIADLDARFKNWNTIRNSVMTPDEVKAMTEERKAEVEKAGVDETAIVPSDDFHLLVLDDKELKKQYPTMDEASDYINSQRKDIYHTQEDVERKINDVNDMLEQYINGETELDPNQLMELNTTKAQLEAQQTNLSVAAKGLKAQANKLSKLYKTEVSQQEMEELGMTPSEQRKVLVSDAIKKNDLGAIKEIYKDASVDVTDLTPQTLEEAVSESLSPHSLNPESLQYELGKSNFKFGIGKRYDSNKFNYLIAKKGTGMSVNEFAVRVYNDLPVNLQDMGYTDQDVRNALLDMFKSYDSVKEMRNVALMNRIAAAEDELSSEEEFYEAQKEREIIERQAEIEKYKSYIHEKELSLPSESELDHIYGLEYDRMMEIEDREREYKQYVKSILPELADYDDRSNEEGYGGGSSLGSDSSRRGVDEGNSQGKEVGNGETSSESEIGEGSDSGRKGRQETGSLERGEGSTVRGSHLPQEASFGERLKSAIAETETKPTEAQKKAGNYKKGHLSFGGYDYTVETPKGVTRSGKDEQGKPWSVTMHDTYGYILGKIGVDGDHIDMFINDAADLDTFDGNVYVVDQVNPETGEFDEHKVMYGYPSEEAATEAYLANYSKGWKGLGKVTSVPKATFDKWLESSDRKTKPFADYAIIKKDLYPNYFSDMTEEEAREKLQNDLEKLVEGKYPSEIDYGKLKSIYHSYYLRFGDDVDAAKYRKDVHAIWNKAYATHLKEISKNNAEAFVANLNPFSLKEKINIWKLSEDVDSYVDQNIAEDISNGRSLKDNFFYDDNHRDFYVSIIEKYAKYLAEKNYYLDAALKRYSKEKVTEQEKALRNALIDVIKDSGIEVVTDNKEGQKVLDSIRNVITVYHGAGASFDNFDHSFMGSGEGAQAFGWGTYVTEVPGIANEYSKASSERKLVSPQKLYFKNEEVDSSSYAPWMVAYKTLEKYGKDFDEAFKVLEEKHQQYIKDNLSTVLVGDPDEIRTSVYSSAIEVLKEEQKNPGSLIFEPAVFEERERNLYVVEIPKDEGDNYLDWDSPMSDVKYEKLSKLLSDKKLLVPANRRGSELYNLLAKSLDTQKNASLMLSSLGFVGIKYPANYRSGGRKDGALNYVIFQEADAKIYKDYKFFRSSDGTVYGFVHDGKIYIDPSIATSEVPIHEYTHIWSRQLRSANPKEWANIISLMKGTTIWDEVKNSNKNLKTDSDIADEVLAIYSGRKGSQRIKDEFNKIIEEDSSLLDKAKAMNAIHKVKQAINKFWKAVTDFLHVHFGSADEVADTVLRDFLNEVNPLKQKSANEGVNTDKSLPFDAPMNMDNLPFHRDVKEVKPSDMTEAQKVAYDAVSTMLKKAGIPVKVVSNEDMEKVAEAQDNLNLAMLLNHPEMRFKIKTPEEKQAAENAYNYAKELRPNKWAQYAVVDMSNPNKMPEYYQKQELARKERTYLNRLMWGNYKVFNLDKSFEDNVAGLTGSFPSEFDPYKIDAQTNKKNELKKQIKETEEAYKLTGQERKEYQNQLMKEYMDEHGLASENDIPDDVWREFDYKAIEKYQDKLDSLFAKYKDLDRQLKAIVQPGVQYLKGKGVVYGYTDGKEIVLNQEHLNANTPIHEYQHLWRTAAKEMNPELIEHGDKLIMQTQLFADLKQDPNYNHLTDEQICDEAFARLTGEDGAAILEQMAKDAIKENPLDTAKELSVINKLKEWLKKFWYWTLDTFTKWKPEDIKKMTLEDIRNLVLRDLANGVDPRNVKSRMTKEDAVSLRKQMEDNAEQERILEHTEENWQKEFGKDSRVTTPIGSIKLGENQYKKAGRNDRIKRFGLLKPTLERPDVILEKSAPKEGAERQTKYLFVKSFKKADGNKILNYESITVKQGEEEVAISAHQIEPSKVVKELTESKMLWNRFRGDSNSLGENQGSALTPSANNPSGNDSVLNPHSDAKIRNNIETAKGIAENLSVEDKIKAVSQQFGVDEADVAMYANAIKKGSTAEAARARANIKRHLMQVNEGNIFSFKDVVKYTKPINEALKENFGDLDAMIEERIKQVEAERNAMEAARKRAEEEEAKRQKHLEELSLIPDDQLDKQYMDALAKGDDAAAREMLDEAARRKGFDDTESSYQGVGAWKAPGNPGYESDKARRDDWESSGSDVNLEDMALGYTPQPDDYFSHPERYSQNTPHGLESVKAINAAIDAIKNGEKDVKVKVYRAVPTSVKEGKLRNGDWVTPSKKYADIHGNNRLEGKYRIIEDEVPANQLWWDGNDANEFGFDDGKAYKYKNAKNNRKLNDLVTYDDKGDVIPPSKRFNSRKRDIRFMFAGEKGAAEVDKAEEKTYRMDNLKVAEKMERGKKDAKAIKLATGWERGADGKWRYEMPDAKIKDMKDIGGGNIVKRFDDDMLWNDGKLTDVIDAPGLFEAYPQLKDVRIDTDAIMNDMPSNGVYNAKTNTITIHADELKYMNSILNHEIQHAIQYIEGFGKGGSPEQMEKEFKAAQDEWKARAYAHELEEKAKEMGGEYNQSEVEKALVEEYKDLDMSDELPDKETRIKGFNYFARGYADRSMDDAIKRFRLNESTRSDFDSYKEYLKLAGEVESRNVEKRLGMTDEERRNSLAEETEDVPRDLQIVSGNARASYKIVEQKLKKHPDSLMKAGTYFSGGGLVEEGLKGIIDPVVAVEYDRKISGVYRNNFGQHIVTADVRDVDPKELVKHIDGEVEYFHASPVCKNYSQAKSNSGEVELDKETAKSTADFIDAVKPRVVTIENVKGYKDSEAMKIITQALDKNGYTWDADVYNAADFGGYTNRERLIVRAVKNGELPEKPKKQPRKGGWLEAVEDILPTLTVKESGVAPWMDARLKADGIDWQKVEKPLYVMGSAYADGKIPHAYGDEILPTLRTKSGDVIIMPGGKVLRADGRVLARITGLGDDYLLPKTESLAHTIIGNGIPVQLTQGVIAPLLNKDDLSGRNVLARLGKSIFKNDWDADKQKKVSDQVVNTANKLGGAEATVYTSVDEVPDAYLSEVKNGATGWYDPETHTVHVYLPNCADASEAERTVLHEKIGHEGMEVLLGGEDEVRKFANFVYNSVAASTRGKILEIANEYDPDWKKHDRMNVGTQEYIAHLAEEGPKTAEDFSLWTKIKHYLIKVLKKLGIRVPGLLNDKDLRYYLMKAGKALHVWDNMPKEKQEAMMKQASNAEIKDALGEGAKNGKPRQKKGESMVQYMKRVQEWRKWKNAREDENDPEPPMFYDIDKDEAGKKEWVQLNKDWRERHHLAGEEPTGLPIRMEGEEYGAYMTRIHEYEKWKDAMKDQEDPMPDMFAFEKKKQEEVKRKYEDWLARHELLEQQQADLDLYEGKIYPAETNPKADDLEQQVMQDLAEVTSTDVSKEGAAKTVKHAVIHRRKNMEEASADDAIYINDVKNRIEKMADSGAFDKLLSDYQGKPNRAEKLAEAIPYIIEAPRRLRDLAHDLNATGAFDKGHIHIQPADVEAIQPYVADLITETGKKHTELRDDKEVEVYDDPQAVSDVASKMAQVINDNHQGEEGFVPIDGTDILSEHVLPLVKQQIVPEGIDYKNLSPEMQAALDSIRDWYNYTYDWLKDNRTLKEDTGYNVDYVNHIWDKEKSDKQAYALYVENRQRTKSPNEKKRTISTLMEGISVGLVPKTTDITKMMAYYSRSNIEAWVNKTMLQELSGLNVIERNEDGEVVSTDPLLSSSAPFNLEQYQYFEIPGVGPVWVYNVSPKQVKVKNPITGKEKVLYSEASAGDRFGVVFETYQSSPFWKAFDTLASSAKKLELGFSGFHAGALTEVYMVQNMVEFGPKKAMANFMKYIFVDTAKNHELPCFANPQDFQEAASHLVKFGATNDYSAADVQNMFDNMRDAMMKVQEKLRDGNGISGTVAVATMPLKVVTQMLSLINKGMDRALWDFLHDGLKLATYRMRADKTKERAKKKGWSAEELSRALDEDGQFVNDMFGGQHWDVLGASHRTLRYAGRVLLSPDWNASTTRHFLALTGFGSIWNEATFENFKQYYQRLWHKELMPEDEGRRSRQISALLCYGIGFMVFYEAFANGINAAFRALDEEKERKKAEEIRKTNPSYKSMYELAYPDGMKWYDYLMRGNSLGQQSKIFMGRYEDGTEMYIRHGKQFREVPEYLFNHKGELEFPGPMVQRMIGKANPMVRMTLDDINYLSDFQASHADQEIQRKYGKTIGLLYKDALYWAPFLIPSQENKEFKAVDFFFPSSKGFSPWKAQSYFKDFILSGDMEGVVMTYQSCQRNGIDAEAQIKAAIGSVKALESAEMSDGVTSLQEASKRFDAAKSITEKKKMRQKMKKFLSQSDYKAFTQKEALDMVQGYLNGDEDLKEMEKAESKYLMAAKAEDVTEDWRIQNAWNGTMETYQEYQRLKDVDKAKANAFKNSKTNKRLFVARKAISAAKKKMNKAKKQMDGSNSAAKMVEIRKTRKELLNTLNGME